MRAHAEYGISTAKNGWPDQPPDPIEWAEQFVEFPASVRSRRFNCSITPWLREPILRAAHGIWMPTVNHGLQTEMRVGTFVKPVQAGGSVAGEVLLAYVIAFGRGFLQYNWSNDKRAKDRWESRIEGILKANSQIKTKLDALAQNEATKCEVDFGSVFFRMQGAFNPANLDSDSVHFQINEEVHDWEAGHLKKARNRSTAVWNYKSIDISNAGKKGGQLHQAFQDGTQQHWEVKCPGCGLYHAMHTRWDERRPDLGGLRYDTDKARRPGGNYDYNALRSTLRFQMPCGYVVYDDPQARRALSTSGRYSEPRNTGAELTHRSWTFEAVTVDYIDWMQLVKDKHDALRARKLGDPEPWYRYVTERECIFYDPDDVPLQGRIILNSKQKKNRDGLPGEKLRLGALDRQAGEAIKGEFPYWWLLIRDYQIVDGKLRSLLVYEGRIETDDGVLAVLDEHNVKRFQVVADSGHDTTHVYLFCLQNGIHAIKGGKEEFYTHKDGARRIYSAERPLHSMVHRPSIYPYLTVGNDTVPDPREPAFWLYGKAGIRERLHWIRTTTEFITPSDVSEDYQQHMEAEERVSRRHPRTGEEIVEWVQQKSRNDQFVNECYCAMQVDMAGLVGATLGE